MRIFAISFQCTKRFFIKRHEDLFVATFSGLIIYVVTQLL